MAKLSDNQKNLSYPYKDIGGRIKNLRENLGLSGEEFAEIFEKSKQNISDYETGKSVPKPETLAKMANYGSVTLDWLLTGKESTFTPPITDLNKLSGNSKIVETQMYPVVNRVTAGNYDVLIEADNVCEYIPLTLKRKNCFLLEVEGDSMTCDDNSKSIQAGDYLLVDTTEIPVHGDVVVVLIDSGRQMVKQFFRNNGKFELRSFNPDHPPIYVDPDMVQVMYRVVYVQPRIRKV